MSFEAWENQMFDEYNGEAINEMEFEADLYDTLEYGNSIADITERYGRYDYE